MIVSVQWLKELVDISISPGKLADLLTNAGLESDVIFNGRALDIEITPNRPDCMSHVGVAREIAVLTGQKMRYPQIHLKETTDSARDAITVRIENPRECPRYACRVVRNVTVGSSPVWMTQRLEITGLRGITNVVDISNYVLLELGHPLHAFDLDRIGGREIVVRMARTGESLTTLDGEDRKLKPEHLLICDAKNPIALAGIMGGENSEVSGKTTNVLIESAYFDPVTVRKGARALGISTEASKRFERGMDYEGLLEALDRAASLLAEFTGGEILKGVVDEYPKKLRPAQIHFSTDLASSVAGEKFSDDFVENTFKGLEITFSKVPDGYDCIAPTFRPDLERPIDLTEELARIHGYGKVRPDFSYHGWLPAGAVDPLEDLIKLKRFFAGLGFNEALSNSLLSPAETKYFAPERAVTLQNPLSKDMSVLRTSLFPGLLKSVNYNHKRGEYNLALFEYGDVFLASQARKTGCDETDEFSGVICGDKSPKQWKDDAPRKNDFFTLKGYMESLARFLKIRDRSFSSLNNPKAFSLGQSLTTVDGQLIGEFGLFPPSVLKTFDIDIDVFGFTLNLSNVRQFLSQPVSHTAISPYPGVSRDLSFIVSQSTSAGDVEKLMKEFGGSLLKKISLYDFYEGDQVGKGYKSITFSLFFQEGNRTLTDQEVDDVVSTIISEASKNLNAKLR